MPNPKVDIIVPVYNVSKYLKKCLESLCTQTYTNINIYLVDDGSTDDSGEICDEYTQKDKRIKVIHKENGGLISSWTMGLKYSDAKWVVFVDGDDWIESQHVELLIKEQLRTGADIVVTHMKQIDQDQEELIEFCIPAGKYSGEKLENELYPVMINAGGFEKRGVPFSRCGKLIRKSIIVQNLNYLYEKATYEEDFNIIAPCLMDAKIISIMNTEDSAYCYRRVETSMLHGYDANMLNSISNIYPRLFEACNIKDKKRFIEQIKYEYVSATVRLFLNETKNPAGYGAMNKNILEIVSGKLFKQSIEMIDSSSYPFKFRVVLYILKNYNVCLFQLTAKLIYTLRKFG